MINYEDPTIEVIKFTVWEILPGSEVILFGSRARKDNLKDSDYDLLIIAERSFTQSEQLKFQALIRKALAVKNILADVIVQQKSSIAMKMKLPGHIVRSAMLEGIRV